MLTMCGLVWLSRTSLTKQGLGGCICEGGDGGGAFCNSPQTIPRPAPALYAGRGQYVCIYKYASAKLERVLKSSSGETVMKKHCVRSCVSHVCNSIMKDKLKRNPVS